MEKVLPDPAAVAVDNDTPPVPQVGLVERLGARSIVLVGLMGAGKTTIGRRLATRLGLAFQDADHEIERVAKMTIPDLFAKYGEPEFRRLEKRVVTRLLAEEGRIVLATGGGAFMNEETRRQILTHAVSVWLKADHETLMRRVRRRANRPLLRTDDPEGTMRRLMDERHPVYALADITVQSLDASHDTVTQDVLDRLAAHLFEGPAP